MKRIRFSADAHREIAEIVQYLYERNPFAAHRFLGLVDEKCELLAERPLIGRLRPELGEEIRSFVAGNYLMFYVPGSEGIDVYHVIYGGRDLSRIFKRQSGGTFFP